MCLLAKGMWVTPPSCPLKGKPFALHFPSFLLSTFWSVELALPSQLWQHQAGFLHLRIHRPPGVHKPNHWSVNSNEKKTIKLFLHYPLSEIQHFLQLSCRKQTTILEVSMTLTNWNCRYFHVTLYLLWIILKHHIHSSLSWNYSSHETCY